jgi:hypothetical protein
MTMNRLDLAWRPALATVACALVCTVLPLRNAAAQITVGRNVQVTSADPASTFGEVMLSAHPTDSTRLLGCGIRYVTGENKRETVLYRSSDRGASWRRVFDTGHFPDSSDPACSFGAGDLAFHTALAQGEELPDSSAIGSYRSTDGGRTWRRTAGLWSTMGALDRQSITVDTASASPYRGRVYVNGTSAVPSLHGTIESATWGTALYVSTDSGQTYRQPILRGTTTGYILGMGNSVVLSDGTLVSVFGDLRENTPRELRKNTKNHPNADLKVVISSDGGDRFGPAVTVSDWYMPFGTPYGSSSPYVAADPRSAAFKDRIYAVFTDERSGRPEVLVSRSSNRGRTWSKPLPVSDDRAAIDPAKGPRNYMPVVAVNKDGVVGVMWYRAAHPEGDPGWEVRFAASCDGGETWTASVPVSAQPARYDAKAVVYAAAYRNIWEPDTAALEGPVNVDILAQVRQFEGGDYAGLAADAGGVFHAFWVDNRTRYSQIWTAPVAVPGRAVKHGSPELAALDDVSSRVRLDVTDTRFDRARNDVTVSATLKNVGTDTLRGPVKVRVLQLRSELGVPTVVGADNGVAVAGAVWDFTATFAAAGLAPNAVSAAKRLTFHLTDVRPFLQEGEWKAQLVNFDARVFGKPSGPSTAMTQRTP